MSYIALYRKFRPQTFAEIKGQDHVVRALQNQLINRRIGHAYLFTGTRGTGKTSAAKILAKAVNCLHPVNGEPCNECEHCRAINAGNFIDVAEVDAASNNGVDDIRRIIEEVRYTPVKGEYKVYIIDEAHMITGAAFNAFLKTLEEPPSYAVFILATTEPHKLPVTILSRCQRYDFHRIRTEQIAENLASIMEREGLEAEDRALSYIARAADGSMRDSISLLDKCIAFSLGERLTYENVLDTLGTVDTEVFSRLFREVYAGHAAAACMIIEDIVVQGRDLTQFASDFIWYIRNLLMVSAARIQDPEMLGISPENMALLQQDAATAQPAVLLRYIRILSELLNQIKSSMSKRVLLETGIIRLAVPQMETDTQSLEDRIRQMEQRLNQAPVQQMNRRTEQPPAPAPAALVQTDDDEEFFAGFGPGVRMENPDAFAGLMDEEPVRDPREVYENRKPEEQLPSGTGNGNRQDMLQRQPDETGQASAQISGSAGNPDFWQSVIQLCTNPRVRAVLHKCSASAADSGVVRIVTPSIIALKQLTDESVASYVKELAGQVLGGTIQIQAVLTGSDDDTGKAAPAQAADASGDAFPQDLLNHINFNIGTEEW